IQVSHGLGPQKTISFLFDVHGNPHQALKDKGVINMGCSRHMTGNVSFLSDFKEFNGGYVAFGGNPKGGKISGKDFKEFNGGYVAFGGNPKGGKILGKCKIKTGKLDFDDVYFVKELKFNLFSFSQMCDKKNNVLFTDIECVVLSSNIKLPDENHVLLRVPRENNMYNVDLKNVVPLGDLTCIFAKATLDESNHWHRRLGHINFKTMNKLVKDNLVRGLPSKIFKNNHTCVACKKGKQHRASCKSKPISSVSHPLQRLHIDLFRPTFVKSLNKKSYFQVFIDDYSRTPQHNRVAERKNRALIEAARTMLADSLLPIPFWDEVVYTACYVQNRVLVTKPHNKTPYELLLGRSPSIGFMRPFGCPDTILNTLDPLGKFDGKVDERFLVGYSVNSKAFRVFNSRTRIVQETLHIDFLENKPNVAGIGPKWLFDIDTLTQSINYQLVGPRNTYANDAFDVKENEHEVHVSPSGSDKTKKQDDKAKRDDRGKSHVDPSKYPDDPDMPELEDIVYLDDKEDVSAEADFSNLETNVSVTPQTRSMARMVKEKGRLHQINDEDFHTCMFACFLSQEKPKKVHQALKDPSWIEAMQKELLQCKMQKVWVLVDLPKGKRAIGSKWVFRNKKDERGIVIRNKVRLVAQGHTQEEGIDYDEVFAPVERIEAIWLFLAYASFMGFMVYQMDVKCDFHYGTIKEERLHQALRAWYETLANYLLENGFQRGKIDQTLFLKKQKGNILLVQVYVDDITFGSTNKELCKAFEKLMKNKFQMSFMGELTFFLGLQVKQKDDGIFISQDKYVAKILRKFSFTDVKLASTPIETKKPLLVDPDATILELALIGSPQQEVVYS
nr:hypothetical protein [Tanacetum cinerariifolium]